MPRTTELDVLNALTHKFSHIPRGWKADRYVRARHVPYGGAYTHSPRIADMLVIDTYGQTELIGIEVKVTRSDWLTELRQPEKSAKWRAHCHRWYLATHDPSIVKDDLPAGWGLICPDKNGNWRVRKQAELNHEPAPMAPKVFATFTRAVAQTAVVEMEIGHEK